MKLTYGELTNAQPAITWVYHQEFGGAMATKVSELAKSWENALAPIRDVDTQIEGRDISDVEKAQERIAARKVEVEYKAPVIDKAKLVAQLAKVIPAYIDALEKIGAFGEPKKDEAPEEA